MAHYQGTAQEGAKATRLAKQREEDKKQFDKLKSSMQESSKSGLKSMDTMFAAQDTSAEAQFKASTVGLVSAEDFKKKRELMERLKAKEDNERKKEEKKKKKKQKKERMKQRAALTFDTEELGEDDNKEEDDFAKFKKRKMAKDPTTETHFLPDKDREEEEQKLREKLAKEWTEVQEKIKGEAIQITYSYWDGSGHRRNITLPKGTRIDQFLEKCRRDLCNEFTELRGITCEGLMYIKEDLIIPHHYSFYDLIVTKARGKSGPLFHFDVHDDVRLSMNVNVEKDESHAGKIVTRGYYERNQHIFPVNRWEVYDPSKKWDKYTIK